MLALVFLIGFAVFAFLSWDPSPKTNTSFDLKKNGLWLGHKWYTGLGVRSGDPVTTEDSRELIEDLEKHGISHVFIHVGPAGPDGTLPHPAGASLETLRKSQPQLQMLAWLGARVDKLDLTDPTFLINLENSIEQLRNEGFDGVHFDFEPMRDFEDGYLELLERVRQRMGKNFTISQATPRAGPFGISVGPLKSSFWSEEYYRETMLRSDQTVVMAYDTNLSFKKGYITFVRHQTHLMADWACSTPGHEALIGIPAYEDVPLYSDPEIENIRTASLGVRSALESRDGDAGCIRGVAVYANWVTDDDEWKDYQNYWVKPE